ncbi:hypothetical protein JKA74_18445 [Marivirga sp. S37H4]|uniref:DUF6089 domain-containing protein n=1 Tax=Marivirga aurantiaca TaxID=2802615 RepID=A0A934X2D8_9BACT|nr:DUF6089 family protein [Marivirga aurantiaca]MBK6267031.1 hypothetical protein [Marivirga aurantiaca]
MRKVLLLSTLFMAFLIIFPESADAQRRKRRKSSKNIGSFSGSKRLFNPEISYYGIGGGINALNYFGDIAPTSGIASTDVSFTRPGFNIFVKQKFGDRYHWRSNFMWGRLQSSDVGTVGIDNFTTENANRYLRNLSFRNDILELSFTGQIDLFKHSGRFSSRAPLNLYAFGGVGVIYHNPKGKVPEYFSTDPYQVDNPEDFINTRYLPLENAGEWVSLRKLGTEGQFFDSETKQAFKEIYGKDVPNPYSMVQIVIPIGIGARYKLTNNFDLSLEIGYRHTFTDYLDDVGGEYVDLGGFEDPIAAAMSDRSNEFNQTDFNLIQEFTYSDNVATYNSNISPGLSWSRAAGYGNSAGEGNDDPRRNIRGNNSDNDIYIVTNIQLTYILGGSIVRGAKFR